MSSWWGGKSGSASAPAGSTSFSSTAAGGGSSWSYPFTSSGNQTSNSGAGFSSKFTAGGWGGGGSSSGSKWVNMETGRQHVSYMTGELTGENSAFASFGIELTRRQRIIGFAGCLVAGFAISLIGTLLLLTGAYVLFAILYSIGFLVSLAGTGFLVGFGSMFKNMFKPVRIVASLIMWASFVLVWVFAFAIHIPPLAILFCVVLYLAYLWYSLSYIPYARGLVKSMFSKVFG